MDFSCTETSSKDTECNTQTQQNIQETLDPDYLPDFGEKKAQTPLKIHEQDAKENAVKTIKHIVRKQFALEMRIKEQEIEAIDNNIRQTKLALDRIRACVLARYYGMSEGYRPTPLQSSWSKLRRSKRESKLRSLAKTSNSSASSNITNSSSTNLAKQNHEFSNDGKKFEAMKTDSLGLDNLSRGTTLKVENSTSLNNNSSTNSLRDHTYSYNSSSAQHEGKKIISNLLNTSGSSLELIGNFNSSSAKCVNSMNVSRSNPVVNQTPMKFTVNNQPANQSLSFLERDANAAANLKDTKFKAESPVVLNAQANNLIRTSIANEPSSSKSNAHVNAISDVHGNVCGSGSRFYVKKRVIIGNTSKYIPPDRREDNDKSTHKWMVYVRGPPQDPDIDTYIKKVWFFLHPSYRPNDIVEINKPPFQLTRRGWGEFPIRVQLHFVGSWNKRVDIIHELKLDKTYTGLQTLGAETVVDLEIDRKTFEDVGLPVPMDTQVVQDLSLVDEARNSGNSVVSNISDVTKLMTGDTVAMDKIVNDSNSQQVKRIKLEPPSSTSSESNNTEANSICNSTAVSSKAPQIDNNLENQLHILAEKIPLIHPKKDRNFSFRAASVTQFFNWPIGKQRASEWQHALCIRNQLRKACNSSTVTTKEVMVWCRRNGYSLQCNLSVDADTRYCKVCGRLVEDEVCGDTAKLGYCLGRECLESATTSPTLSSALDLLTQVEGRDELLESSQITVEQEVEVNIVNLPVSKQTTLVKSSKQDDLVTISLTEEQQWVRDVCNEIGIGLRPDVLDGVKVNTVNCMLFSAAKQFIKQLMHTAVALSNDTKSSLDCKLLVPNHVSRAIQNIPQFDFLANAYLGVDSEKQFSE